MDYISDRLGKLKSSLGSNSSQLAVEDTTMKMEEGQREDELLLSRHWIIGLSINTKVAYQNPSPAPSFKKVQGRRLMNRKWFVGKNLVIDWYTSMSLLDSGFFCITLIKLVIIFSQVAQQERVLLLLQFSLCWSLITWRRDRPHNKWCILWASSLLCHHHVLMLFFTNPSFSFLWMLGLVSDSSIKRWIGQSWACHHKAHLQV